MIDLLSSYLFANGKSQNLPLSHEVLVDNRDIVTIVTEAELNILPMLVDC